MIIESSRLLEFMAVLLVIGAIAYVNLFIHYMILKKQVPKKQTATCSTSGRARIQGQGTCETCETCFYFRRNKCLKFDPNGQATSPRDSCEEYAPC